MYSVAFHCWNPTHTAWRSHSPPEFCSGTALQCWRPGRTRSCRPVVCMGLSSTDRNGASLRRCPAWRGPEAPVSLLAGQCTLSQCTDSGWNKVHVSLQREDQMFRTRQPNILLMLFILQILTRPALMLVFRYIDLWMYVLLYYAKCFQK